MPTGLADLLSHMPTGHNDLWACENKTTRNSEFLYETSFDKSSVGKISVRDLLANLGTNLCKRCFRKTSWTRSLIRRDLLARSLNEISVQALHTGSFGKIYVRDLLTRSLQQDLYEMSLYKVSRKGVLARCSYKISERGLLARSPD